MHDLYDNLEQLCETVSEEINEANEKVRAAGGKLSSGDVEYLDKLTHMLKSIKTTKAMMEAEEGYSSDGSMPNRGAYARRDSRGRYARDNYSYNRNGRSYDNDMVAELRSLMEEAPDNRTRQKFQSFISDIERMR